MASTSLRVLFCVLLAAVAESNLLSSFSITQKHTRSCTDHQSSFYIPHNQISKLLISLSFTLWKTPLFAFSPSRIKRHYGHQRTLGCVLNVYYSLLMAFLRPKPFFATSNLFFQKVPKKSHQFNASLKSGSGDSMSSTEGLKKKYKEELAKLRLDYLKAGQDPVAQNQIATMIKNRKELLSQLGGQNG